MFSGLTLGKLLKFATGVWLINIIAGWIISVFTD